MGNRSAVPPLALCCLAVLLAAAPAQAALRHEVLEAPEGPVAPEEPVAVRVRFEADCTSVLARVREPRPDADVPLLLAAQWDDGAEVVGTAEVLLDAGPCVTQAAPSVFVEVPFEVVVRGDVPAFEERAVRIQAALEPMPGDAADPVETTLEVVVAPAPVLFLDVGSREPQLRDDGRPVRPVLVFTNRGNAEALVTLHPGPGLAPGAEPFRLAPGQTHEQEFVDDIDGAVDGPRTLRVAWEAVVLRDGAAEGTPERGEATFQLVPAGGFGGSAMVAAAVLVWLLCLGLVALAGFGLVLLARRR